jgi:hypothetical protein
MRIATEQRLEEQFDACEKWKASLRPMPPVNNTVSWAEHRELAKQGEASAGWGV